MAKDVLAFFGLVFLTLIVIAGVLGIGIFYDLLGFVSIPYDVLKTPISLPQSVTLEIKDNESGEIHRLEWSNPLVMLPYATVTPMPTNTPIPTQPPTEIPRMQAPMYRSEVILDLKSFVNALEVWLDVNDRLAGDNSLKDDPTWRNDAKSALENMRSAAWSLSAVGPAPQEYEEIDALLYQVYLEADGLYKDYSQAVDSGDNNSFYAASEHFTRLKEFLSQAVKEMLNSGWTIE